MFNKKGNYYGMLLSVLLVVTLLGLFTSEPETTGFVVLENEQVADSFDLSQMGQGSCADGSLYQECSTIIKSKYCDNGKLVDYCELCGGREGTCFDGKCVK